MRFPLIPAAMNSSREGVYIPSAVIPVAPRRRHREVGSSTRPESLRFLNMFRAPLDRTPASGRSRWPRASCATRLSPGSVRLAARGLWRLQMAALWLHVHDELPDNAR